MHRQSSPLSAAVASFCMPDLSLGRRRMRAALGLALFLSSGLATAEFLQITGPAGSVGFGTRVAVLPNGNVVVTDPNGRANNIGAVYLYSSRGQLISTLTGSTAGDQVGSGGIVVLDNGNFVIVSQNWDAAGVVNAGAVTWASGTTGVSGVVSASNSIVGSVTNDGNTQAVPVALSNGNYVVQWFNWDNGNIVDAGAVRWCSGSGGCTGPMSAANALVGSTAGDRVGNITTVALTNGNYVVSSPGWDNGAIVNAGAVTWGNGVTGTTGVVSTSNSLFGTATNHAVGSTGVSALSNGNYVVGSLSWYTTGLSEVGAATWADGSTGRVGAVSAANSLVGSSSGDRIGFQVRALSNGNYVISSQFWNNASIVDAGAVTWGNGSSGSVGVVSAANSLVGSSANDRVGINVVALSNGHYVTSAFEWDNGASTNAGAATWGNGTSGTSGPVSAANSLIGGGSQNRVGIGITALTNGNYVVASRDWDNGATSNVGAATWRNGSAAGPGVVGAGNSLIGSTVFDEVGYNVVALSNGNYVVSSGAWDGAQPDVGAATWANGASGLVGVVSAGNSWIGSSSENFVGSFAPVALSNGNYVLRSNSWDTGAIQNVGAATWVNGSTGTNGVVGASNSLVGSVANDQVSLDGIIDLTNGFYLVRSNDWDNGALANAGALSLLRSTGPAAGTLNLGNSILGNVAGQGASMVVGFNVAAFVLAIGQPASNLVTVINDVLLSNGFE